MPLGDVLVKVANNETLSEEEKGMLRLLGNQTEINNAFVSGLQNGGSDVFANSLNSNTLPFFPIYTQVLQSAVSSLTIPIPSNAKHIFCIGAGRCTGATYYEFINGRFNGDTGSNYDYNSVAGVNASTAASQTKGDTSFVFSVFQGASSTASAAGSFFSFLPHTRSNLWKTVITTGGGAEYTASNLFVGLSTSHWRSTSPISSITIFAASSTIAAGSVFAIFGMS